MAESFYAHESIGLSQKAGTILSMQTKAKAVAKVSVHFKTIIQRSTRAIGWHCFPLTLRKDQIQPNPDLFQNKAASRAHLSLPGKQVVWEAKITELAELSARNKSGIRQ